MKMDNIVLMTVGLPASGKSTWAENYVSQPDNNAVIVCRDDLRHMLFGRGYKFSKAKEKIVTQTQFEIAAYWLDEGKTVVVADTNLNPNVRQKWYDFATGRGKEIECKYFVDVPLKTLIKNDLARTHSVGEGVIKGMAERYRSQIPWMPKRLLQYPEVVLNPELPVAVLIDVDGTVANMVNRGPYDWDKVSTDEPHQDVIDHICKFVDSDEWMNTHSQAPELIFLSGRDSVCRDDTLQWLHDHFDYREKSLFMRREDDRRKDWVVKQELFYQHVHKNYNVVAVFDDRDQVVDMWRELGLRCYQVAPGDF